MTDKIRVKWDLVYLHEYCKENNVTLLKDYSNERVNRDTVIKTKCLTENCNETIEKHFRQLHNTGCFCLIHTKEISYNKAKNTEWKSDRIRFNNNYLNKYCEDNKIKLLEDYSNISVNRDTVIKSKCLTENCHENVEKRFRQLQEVGCFCEKCTEKRKIQKLKITDWDSNKTRFNNNYLNMYCEDNKIELLEDYSNIDINRDTVIKSKCLTENCHENVEKLFRNIIETSGFYCNNCSNVKKQDKRKITNLEKYGVENPKVLDEVKEKYKNTCLEKYGVETNLQLQSCKEQIKLTNLEKYGVESPQQSTNIRNKSKITCLEKYGVEHISQSDHFKDKCKNTCLQKYGVEYAIQSNDVQRKIKTTIFERYGVENVCHNPEIAERASKNSYRTKTYTFPSGNQIKCQGYEPFALNELIKLYKEEDIILGCTNVPIISYNDLDGKCHKHFVDIFIPSQNKCIEVKSTWTAEKKKDNIFLKQDAGKKLGYGYEIWVYDEKGKKIECYLQKTNSL